ncbi:MAG: oxygen-independent coproporphyrinogen III oxidase [Lachnospiraceae bacterium]|nr:oxygen-independent coproporphyrinogen III oxidase [Lachnospiraceae bacterium]
MENDFKPLALYIHIPFCIKKCLYCDFLSGQASEMEKKAYVRKLIEELAFWKERIAGTHRIQTIFIGGGTPTCLSAPLLQRLGEEILSFPLAENPEYSIEANPGTVSKEILSALKDMQANRISLGLQSAENGELLALGRIHTYEDFVRSYALLKDAGFANINIDLMADIPGQTLASYQRTLEKVCALEPEHISSYSLIVEEGTPFYRMQEEGVLELPDEETDRQMYERTEHFLKKNGYYRYEISNYAKKGWECRHNLTYWEMGEYLGVGLGASSYFSGERFRNETDLKTYLSVPVRKLAVEKNILSKKAEMEEFVFLGLRMMKGISAAEFKKRFAEDFHLLYGRILKRLFHQGLLAESGNRDRIYLTKKGIDVSNMVLAEFLLEDES